MDGLAPCFDRLVVTDDQEPRHGPLNMAIDEGLLEEASDRPVLRFYRWAEPTVSFGCFEPAEAALRLAQGRWIVRRATGGGMVEHGDDLTYTLAVPRADHFVRLRPAESYRLIHAAVAHVLSRCGLQPSSYHTEDGNEADFPEQGNACFQRPVLYDLTAAGQKIAGAAQRRTRAGLLHQGSILFDSTATVGVDAWMDTVRQDLPTILARRHVEQPLSVAQIARAESLAAAKYATSAWTGRF